ncbi:MAG: AAA family ATPase [Deltaproteobacteria bacterium]|nr:AAA family ATPase [Deltaproteobacteria bacterium]
MNVEPVTYFGLTDNPFSQDMSLEPFYETQSAKEALKDLSFFLSIREGIALLIGEDGIGKTTLIKRFTERLNSTYEAVIIFGKLESENEVIETIYEKLGWERPSLNGKSRKKLLQDLVIKLFRKKRELVVIVDDAQNLNSNLLIFLSYLSDLQFSLFRPFHVVFSGNRTFTERLMEKGMEALIERVSVIHVVKPLRLDEVKYYLNYRLNMVSSLFLQIKRKAIEKAFYVSEGNPSRMNEILNKAISLAAQRGTALINERLLNGMEEDSTKKVPTDSKVSVLKVILLVMLYALLIYTIIIGPNNFLDFWRENLFHTIKGLLP